MGANGDPIQDEWPQDHRILRHVTKSELQSLGCLEYPPAKASTLGNTIHQIFHSDRWDEISIQLYESMKPSLKLASLFIVETQVLHYWHALLFGPRERVEELRLCDNGSFETYENTSFRRHWDSSSRTPLLTDQMILDTSKAFSQLSRTTRFRFSWACDTSPSRICRISPRLRQPPLPELSRFGSASDVEVHIGHVGALLDPKFSTSQKLRIQFMFAMTLVHALAHVCNNAIQYHPGLTLEPYFEDDSQAETGFAWAKILNGFPQCVVDMDFANKYGIRWRRFPFSNETASLAARKGEYAFSSRWATNWFTPTQYVADLASKDFWGFNGVARYGPEMLKQPRIFGVREYSNPDSQYLRFRPNSSSDFEPKQGEGWGGWDPKVFTIREHVLRENWDLDGDMVMGDILATLNIDIRDPDGDLKMRDASDLPSEWRDWIPSQVYRSTLN